MGYFDSSYFGGLDASTPRCDESAAVGSLIADRMAEPKSVTVDGVSVSQHSLSELIALEKHNAAKCAARRGIRFQKIIPPGAV